MLGVVAKGHLWSAADDSEHELIEDQIHFGKYCGEDAGGDRAGVHPVQC